MSMTEILIKGDQLPMAEPLNTMATTIWDVEEDGQYIFFHTEFGLFMDIPYTEEAFITLKKFEESSEVLTIQYTTHETDSPLGTSENHG